MRWCLLAVLVSLASLGLVAAQESRGEGPQAEVVDTHGYSQAIQLKRGNSRAILCPEAGGRVIEFSRDGKQALWLDEKERQPEPGKLRPMSAGRFDIGPELTIPAHPKLWSGEWSGKITGPAAAQLVSQKDAGTGVQLTRTFELRIDGSLRCEQKITNVSDKVTEYCHWGRSFSPGGGICLIPLQGTSRFPSKYAMYEDSAIINVRNQDERIRERDGFLEILAPPRKPKLGFDSQAGWLAYVMPGSVLFVKRFPVDPNRVYNEAAGLTLSVWYPEGPRIELEPIGPRERLQPGESASFAEEWFLANFPFPAKGDNIDLNQLRAVVTKLFENQPSK